MDSPIGREHEHRSHRSPWLRAAVLGANDGILSTSALLIGVAAAGSSRNDILIAGFAAIVAGACSMAVGEYVSVSSQRDAEQADLELEAQMLEEHPRAELHELMAIYVQRGVEPGLARLVAEQLMAADAVGAHARDELGITDLAAARPIQAAWTSAVAFTTGALWPVFGVFMPKTVRVGAIAVMTLLALGILGALGAALGGAPRGRGALRTLVLSSSALVVSYAIGKVIGVAV